MPYRYITTQTKDQAEACRATLQVADPQADTRPPHETAYVPHTLMHFRDDYGYPVMRWIVGTDTEMDYFQLVKLLYEPAGKWIEIF